MRRGCQGSEGDGQMEQSPVTATWNKEHETTQGKETEYDKQRLCHTKRKQENIKQRCKRPKQSKTRQSKRERDRKRDRERERVRERGRERERKVSFVLQMVLLLLLPAALSRVFDCQHRLCNLALCLRWTPMRRM